MSQYPKAGPWYCFDLRTTFFESTYPIVMTDRDSLTVEITAPDAGGTGIGSAVNFIVNGDTDV